MPIIPRFYADENFPLAMVLIFRRRGYDVLTSYEANQANRGLPDLEVLKFATTLGRVMITENREDFIQLHQGGHPHAGIVLCKVDRDYEGKVGVLHEFLQQQDQSLSRRLIRLFKQNQKGQVGQSFVVFEYPPSTQQ
jgi:hypothetical protein